jgi:hypothetical protein
MFIARFHPTFKGARSADDDVRGTIALSLCRSLRWHYPDSGSKGVISAAANAAAPLGEQRIDPLPSFDKGMWQAVQNWQKMM